MTPKLVDSQLASEITSKTKTLHALLNRITFNKNQMKKNSSKNQNPFWFTESIRQNTRGENTKLESVLELIQREGEELLTMADFLI